MLSGSLEAALTLASHMVRSRVLWRCVAGGRGFRMDGSGVPPFSALSRPMALEVEEVRALAIAAGLEEIYYNEKTGVVSFASADCDVEHDPSRINVYYTTGTVVTCMSHPHQGRKQLFRCNVPLSVLPVLFHNRCINPSAGHCSSHPLQGQTQLVRCNVSLSVLPEVCHDPDTHTGAGYFPQPRRRYEKCVVCLVNQPQVTLRPCGHDQLCAGCADQLPRREGRLTCPICRAECNYAPVPGAPLSEEYEAEVALEQLRVELESSELQARIQAAQAVIDAAKERRAAVSQLFEKVRQAQQERERQGQLMHERAARGRLIAYHLHSRSKKTIDVSFDGQTLCVALNPSDGVFLVDESGNYTHSGGLPQHLYKVLKKEKSKKEKRKPAYVALGSDDRYYIRFTNGTSQWVGDGKSFDEAVFDGESNGGIRSVAFGKPGSWFIVYGNGSWSNLSNCLGLNNKIKARHRRADLTCVSLGPNGEWFLAAKNRRKWWGGYSNASDLPMQIESLKGRIKFTDFADDDAFIVRYE
eukprot:6172344-Pleurochrysis_carterae.AAC.2